MFSVLFVEDDVDFSAELAEYLSRYCIVAHFMTRIEGLGEKLQEVRPDILVLDQFIVGRDTLLEIPKIRAHFGGGIVVFTGNLNAVDRIVGLECGADDFISKQCDSREFVARLRAVLRRVKSDEAPQTQAAAPQPGGWAAAATNGNRWIFDTTRATVCSPTGTILRLTGTEFDFLMFVEQHAGELLTRDEISKAIFRRSYSSFDRAVDNMLSRLRKILSPHLNGDSAFRSVRGMGYIFAGLNRTPDEAGDIEKPSAAAIEGQACNA